MVHRPSFPSGDEAISEADINNPLVCWFGTEEKGAYVALAFKDVRSVDSHRGDPDFCEPKAFPGQDNEHNLKYSNDLTIGQMMWDKDLQKSARAAVYEGFRTLAGSKARCGQDTEFRNGVSQPAFETEFRNQLSKQSNEISFRNWVYLGIEIRFQ